MTNKHVFICALYIMGLLWTGCKSKDSNVAMGAFEAVEIVVAAENMGQLVSFNIQEGDTVQANQILGVIDTTQLYLKKKQLYAQIKAISSRLPDIAVQTQHFNQQAELASSKLNYLKSERQRLANLVASDAATTKQLDDIDEQIVEATKQIKVIQDQKEAQISALQTATKGLKNDPLPLMVQIEQIDDQISKSLVKSPISGRVLTKIVEEHEFVNPGKPLFTCADTKEMTFRGYFDGIQLNSVHIGDVLPIVIDVNKTDNDTLRGKVIWISSEAEFTPKTIKTQDERTNQVYAVKLSVDNRSDRVKIGMYGEVVLKENP
ncbi:MAG: HlyD family efflux transporter periplasmic adaptor subunit [Saprospiraceae bacterium]|nr:HlyD family efflux transporter periplasmic adaptor subunit [Saprospiraceae bacterium]